MTGERYQKISSSHFRMTAWQERGLRFRNQDGYNREARSHCLKPPTQVKHLTLSHVELSFEVFVIGIFVAILFLLSEYTVSVMQNSRQKLFCGGVRTTPLVTVFPTVVTVTATLKREAWH